jgi:exonuclease III
MRFLFWNVRGLGKGSRRRQVQEFIAECKLDILGLQETIKENFSDKELRELAGGRDFTWQWSPAKGRSGGLLMGINLVNLEMEDFRVLEFYISMSVRDRKTNFRWIVVTVYGPANHDKSADF